MFIRRTIQKWFTGKYFHLEIEDYDSSLEYINIRTQYIFIGYIRFGFSRLTKIVFYYHEPHSESLKEIRLGINDFYYIKLIEAGSEFIILQKFYPIQKTPKPNPLEQFANIKNKKK